METGAQKVLKWINEYYEVNGTPTLFEIKAQLEMAIDDENTLSIDEENNGWIKIESESDLPKEGYGLYHVMTKTDIFCNEPKNQNIEEFWSDDVNKSDWWIKNVSHYQPLKKPQPPLF